MAISARVLARVAEEVELRRNVLVLNYCNLEAIPELVFSDPHCIENLCELCLKYNHITSLPKGLTNLRTLSSLYLPNNHLVEVPGVLASIPSLAVLDVSKNSIASISPLIANMRCLHTLNLSDNLLSHLPDELWGAENLECLNLQGNQLEYISNEIIHCQSLEKLILDCNKILFIPTQVTKLSKLKSLSLAGNKLKSLPNDFSGTMLLFLLVDMNPELSYIPVSLASVSWWGTLGIEGCHHVRVQKEKMDFLRILNPCISVPPLAEITARYLHKILGSEYF